MTASIAHSPDNQTFPTLLSSLHRFFQDAALKADGDLVAFELLRISKHASYVSAIRPDDRDDLIQTVFLQMLPRGILADSKLREMVHEAASEEQLRSRLTAQFCQRLRHRTIDHARKETRRRTETIDENCLQISQPGGSTLPTLPEMLSVLKASNAFSLSEQSVLRKLLQSNDSIRTTARRIGISKDKAARLSKRATLLLRKEFNVR